MRESNTDCKPTDSLGWYVKMICVLPLQIEHFLETVVPKVTGEKPSAYELQVVVLHFNQDDRSRLFNSLDSALQYLNLMPLNVDLHKVDAGYSKIVQGPNLDIHLDEFLRSRKIVAIKTSPSHRSETFSHWNVEPRGAG